MSNSLSETSTTDLFEKGIVNWAESVRNGERTIEQTIAHCLETAHSNAELNAYECLDDERALNVARGLDTLLANGTDFGPLMGLPLGIKDIIAVDGLATTNGSNAQTSHLNGSEGGLIKTLKASGAIVLGKTKTVEFALGATGVNESRGTPWNPVDRKAHRIPGGSSSGSAVALASGSVGLAIGTDTGGSIRIPACFTGIVGHKTTVGRWPLDGIFPLSPTLDSVGPLCRTVSDAALLHTLMTGESVERRQSLKGMHFGVPHTLFLDDLDEQVAKDFEAACNAMCDAGAIRVDIDFPEAVEREYLFPDIVGPEILTSLTTELFEQIRNSIDTVTEQRAAHGLHVTAINHLIAQKRRQYLESKALKTFHELNCWVSPTCPFVPMTVESLNDKKMFNRSLQASRNTQPGNLLGMCGISLPMHQAGLPTGLQLMMPGGQDKQLLELSYAVQAALKVN